MVAVVAEGLVVVATDQGIGRTRPRHDGVASSIERIEQAKADWREGRFRPVPGDDEAVPLPEEPANT